MQGMNHQGANPRNFRHLESTQQCVTHKGCAYFSAFIAQTHGEAARIITGTGSGILRLTVSGANLCSTLPTAKE